MWPRTPCCAETARRMKSSVRPYDSIGRYGGEESPDLCRGCDPPRPKPRPSASANAWSATRRHRRPFHPGHLQASAVSARPPPRYAAAIPWSAIRLALYQAKDRGATSGAGFSRRGRCARRRPLKKNSAKKTFPLNQGALTTCPRASLYASFTASDPKVHRTPGARSAEPLGHDRNHAYCMNLLLARNTPRPAEQLAS